MKEYFETEDLDFNKKELVNNVYFPSNIYIYEYFEMSDLYPSSTLSGGKYNKKNYKKKIY